VSKIRFNPLAPEKAAKPASKDYVEATRKKSSAADELTSDGRLVSPEITIVVPNYGGITVRFVDTPTEGMLKVLDLLVRYRDTADGVLVNYGVLLAQLKEPPVEGFCLRRGDDGWSIAVPEAQDRSQALLQILQALLVLSRGPLANVFAKEHIQPYRD
jgi:hypothetical protein